MFRVARLAVGELAIGTTPVVREIGQWFTDLAAAAFLHVISITENYNVGGPRPPEGVR
jgi:hypothetical protein